MFLTFFKISENLRKSSGCSELFGNLRKCSELFGNFPDVIGNVRNDSQELKSFGTGF